MARKRELRMPTLRPHVIPTKGQFWYVAIGRWMFCQRVWTVVEDWTFHVERDNQDVVIPAGFEFDGVTVPRGLWWLVSPTGILMIPALLHDYAYRYDRLLTCDETGTLVPHMQHEGKAYWDRPYLDVAIDVNGFRWINRLSYSCVRWGGRRSWRSKKETQSQAIALGQGLRCT